MNAEDMYKAGTPGAAQLRAVWDQLVAEHGEEEARAKLEKTKAKSRAGLSIGGALLTGLVELVRKWKKLKLLQKLNERAIDNLLRSCEKALSWGRSGEIEGFNTIYEGVTNAVPDVFDVVADPETGKPVRRPVTYIQMLLEKRPEAVYHGMRILGLGDAAECQAVVKQLEHDNNLEPVLTELSQVLLPTIKPLYLMRSIGGNMTTAQYFAAGDKAAEGALNAIGPSEPEAEPQA